MRTSGAESGPRMLSPRSRSSPLVKAERPEVEVLLHADVTTDDVADLLADELDVVHVGLGDGARAEDGLIDIPKPVDEQHSHYREAAALWHARGGL